MPGKWAQKGILFWYKKGLIAQLQEAGFGKIVCLLFFHVVHPLEFCKKSATFFT